MAYKSTEIVRGLMKVTGDGLHLFSDRTKTGRSIKVWGWKRAHYETAVQAMNKQGIPARLVTTPVINASWGQRGGQMRIRTTEARQ